MMASIDIAGLVLLVDRQPYLSEVTISSCLTAYLIGVCGGSIAQNAKQAAKAVRGQG